VISKVSNYVSYASGNAASLPMVDENLRNNPNIYPPTELKAKMFTLKILPAKVNREITREWTKVKTGK
jgi:putrescine transport system substrate-binding protein